jgi:hypothetical protein
MKSRIVVVIPIYKDLSKLTDLEILSLKNNLDKLKNRDIYIITKKTLQKSIFIKINSFINSKTQLNVLSFKDFYFESLAGYNSLMVEKFFYKSFKRHEYIFICQLGVWIFFDDLDFYSDLGYSYIGGLCFNQNASIHSLELKQILAPINGGASLRKVKDHINALTTFVPWGGWMTYFNNSNILNKLQLMKCIKIYIYSLNYFKIRRLILTTNEDMVFYELSLVNKKFTMPKIDLQNKVEFFSWDSNPKILYGNLKKLPMAAHAWFRNEKPYIGNLEFWSCFINHG